TWRPWTTSRSCRSPRSWPRRSRRSSWSRRSPRSSSATTLEGRVPRPGPGDARAALFGRRQLHYLARVDQVRIARSDVVHVRLDHLPPVGGNRCLRVDVGETTLRDLPEVVTGSDGDRVRSRRRLRAAAPGGDRETHPGRGLGHAHPGGEQQAGDQADQHDDTNGVPSHGPNIGRMAEPRKGVTMPARRVGGSGKFASGSAKPATTHIWRSTAPKISRRRSKAPCSPVVWHGSPPPRGAVSP